MLFCESLAAISHQYKVWFTEESTEKKTLLLSKQCKAYESIQSYHHMVPINKSFGFIEISSKCKLSRHYSTMRQVWQMTLSAINLATITFKIGI